MSRAPVFHATSDAWQPFHVTYDRWSITCLCVHDWEELKRTVLLDRRTNHQLLGLRLQRTSRLVTIDGVAGHVVTYGDVSGASSTRATLQDHFNEYEMAVGVLKGPASSRKEKRDRMPRERRP